MTRPLYYAWRVSLYKGLTASIPSFTYRQDGSYNKLVLYLRYSLRILFSHLVYCLQMVIILHVYWLLSSLISFSIRYSC